MDEIIQRVTPRSNAEIEREATTFLNQFQPKRLRAPGPTDIIRLFQSVRLMNPEAEYGVVDLPLGEMGRLTPEGCVELSEETYTGALNGNPRCRWTIAHELGHLILHFKQLKRTWAETGRVRFARAADVPVYENPEIQAHKFAAGILCPLPAMKLLLAQVPPHELEQRVLETFQISRQAAEKRIATLIR